MDMQALGKRAKAASYQLAKATTEEKNLVISAIADALDASRDVILQANAKDLQLAREKGLSETLIRDRFDLTTRMQSMIDDTRNVLTLPDPVGRVDEPRTLANGLRVHKRRTPFGVLGVIYEARPNVTVDVAVLGLKTNNSVLLRGGSEVHHSNQALVQVIRDAIASVNNPHIPTDSVVIIDSTDRIYVEQMLKLYQYIDMIIPRGGASLHAFCRENSMIPVITGGLGICHLYVDATANQDDALNIIFNAKTQRPSVCNAVDTILVHASVATEFFPKVVERLAPAGVQFKAEPRAYAVVQGLDAVEMAGAEDFDTEWMALVLGLKVVDSLDEAMEHIRDHSTAHSDGILTQTEVHANRFIHEVDSAAVFVNASTRFNDGSALGLGAEIAVSTQKMHARGPMALEELTTYKWVVVGDGHVRP